MPRDPKRIDEAIAILKAVWKRHPDLRLGQLIHNAAVMSRSNADLFYVEDNELMFGLGQLLMDNVAYVNDTPTASGGAREVREGQETTNSYGGP